MAKKIKELFDLRKVISTLLICIAVDFLILLLGTIAFTIVYVVTGGVPEMVVQGFYAVFGFEVFACTAIKVVKLIFPSKEDDNYG